MEIREVGEGGSSAEGRVRRVCVVAEGSDVLVGEMGECAADVAESWKIFGWWHEDRRGGFVTVVGIVVKLNDIVHVNNIFSKFFVILVFGIEVIGIESIIAKLETRSGIERFLRTSRLARI